MSLTNSHYCNILLNMSQINAHFSKLKIAKGNFEQATGNYTHLLNNRVNKPIAYITSLFSISFQSVSFYSHYFGKMPFKAFSYIT